VDFLGVTQWISSAESGGSASKELRAGENCKNSDRRKSLFLNFFEE